MMTRTHSLLTKVADRVLKNTSYLLRHIETGETFAASDHLGLDSKIIIDSHHNGWFYQNLLVHQGLRLLGEMTGNDAWKNYPKRQFSFMVKHLPFFKKQFELGLLPEPRGEEADSRIRYYFLWDELWMTGLTPIWLDEALATRDPVCLEYADRFAAFVKNVARIDQGLLANIQTQIRTDDAYLMLPGILRLAELRNDPSLVDEAIFQMKGFHRRLFDRKDFLYRHIWDIATGAYAPAYWGRGNGWMALAHVDLLEKVSKHHRNYGELLDIYREQMSGLLRWQRPEGGWHQVMEEGSSWVESSSTGMFIWALAKGLKNGWLADRPNYEACLERAWARLCENVLEDGTIIDTCPSTGPGDKNHHLNRPRRIDDTHSMGPFLMAGAAYLLLHSG